MSGRPVVVRLGECDVIVDATEGGALLVDGVQVTVEPAGAGGWRVRSPQGTRLVYVVPDDNGGWWAWSAGDVFQPELGPARRAASPRRREAEGVLASPMPATVRAVRVRTGQPVRKGETVLTLEAMKMELPLRAPADGIVTAVHCREGELVQPSVALVEIS